MFTGNPLDVRAAARNNLQLNVVDTQLYLEQIKSQFAEQPAVINQFLGTMNEFKAQTVDIAQVIHLFHGYKDLILGFNAFLPPGYKLELRHDPKTGCVTTGFSVPGAAFSPLPFGPNVTSQPDAGADQGHANATGARLDVKTEQLLVNQMAAVALDAAYPAPTEARVPIEFYQAVNYVNKIKSRFSTNVSVYKRFLDILQTYQKEQRTIQEVYEQVSELFRDHADLLSEFSHFLPAAENVARP